MAPVSFSIVLGSISSRFTKKIHIGSSDAESL